MPNRNPAPPPAFVEIKKSVGRGAGRGDIFAQLQELNDFQRLLAPNPEAPHDDFVRKAVGRPTLPTRTAAPAPQEPRVTLPIPIDRKRLAALCDRHGIQKLAFFGSVLRADFGPDSDLDVLVEFKPGRTPGLAFFRIQDELSALFGRRVDLNTRGFVSRYFRDEVEREAEIVHVAA